MRRLYGFHRNKFELLATGVVIVSLAAVHVGISDFVDKTGLLHYSVEIISISRLLTFTKVQFDCHLRTCYQDSKRNFRFRATCFLSLLSDNKTLNNYEA